VGLFLLFVVVQSEEEMKIKLRPCPFCGGTETLCISHDVETGDPCVQCSWCGAMGPRTASTERAKDEWNRRVEEESDEETSNP
jgi:Lar family restriction alleviation protein